MLSKRFLKMQGYYNRTEEGKAGVGINQNVLRQNITEEQE